MLESKRYVVALRHGLDAIPDLHDRLAALDGVTVLGGSPRQMQVQATLEAIERIRSKISSHYHVEEVVPRAPI